ncbi:helix-turn-helix domain-containing protein [Anoxynatronum sibiricum]|uniref:Helix-turn-helix domain-containing protein n=1 Tax=Anoxynatronum sibiricum TaxID=210623 RepID=A0ABU9VTY8_9CLOT
MKTLHQKQSTDRQQFDWGNILWLHEPEMASDRRVSVARVTIEATCFQERHFHLGEEQLFYVIRGKGLFITDRGQETVSPGMVVYVPPYSEHEVQNTGETPLVFDVIYVPVRLKQPEKPMIYSKFQSLQEVVSQEMLQSICDQMKERLKLSIVVMDADGSRLTKPQDESNLCQYCEMKSKQQKQKHQEAAECLDHHSFQAHERIWHCQCGLKRLYVPILMGDQVVGSIRSERFLFNNEDVHRNMVEAQVFQEDIPKMIKSRVHVMVDHLETAANFVQLLMERQVFDRELTEKENALVRQAQEKLQLMDALKKANEKLGYRTIFAATPMLAQEAVYPYPLEKKLEKAIETGSIHTIRQEIADAKALKLPGEAIVPEMIAVLLRAVLKPLEDMNVLMELRGKYHQLMKENPGAKAWRVLEQCCLECVELLRHHQEYQSGEMIEGINRYLRHHFRRNVTLTTVAEQFYVSPNYLSHLFNEQNQVSFSEYVQRLRVEEAKEMLVKSRMRVSDIGKQVGFNHDSYFVSVFKKHTGTTPNEYRKHHGSTSTMVNEENK